jgi:hypothetical protein
MRRAKLTRGTESAPPAAVPADLLAAYIVAKPLMDEMPSFDELHSRLSELALLALYVVESDGRPALAQTAVALSNAIRGLILVSTSYHDVARQLVESEEIPGA